MSRLVLVVNPNSAGGQTRRRWPQLEGEIRSALPDVAIRFTERQGHATELARLALREGAEVVVAMGGDGTINEVVNGFFDDGRAVRPEAAFAVLPAGTGGDFIKTTGTPRLLAEAARALATATPRTIDVGRLDYTTADGRGEQRHFINIASFGMGGLVDQYVNRSSKVLGGKVSFFLATMRASLTFRNPRVRLRLDGGAKVERVIYSVAVANGRYFGGGMFIAPAAQLDDGRFDVVTIGDVSLPQVARHSGAFYRGTHVQLPFITVERASRVEAEAADPATEVLLDVDGEQPGRLPATFTVLPRAIRVLG